MNLSNLINQLYWLTIFGWPRKKISPEQLFDQPSLIQNPVFFLSTGRCGTEWFTHALKNVKGTVVLHNPLPSLSVQNKFMHKLFLKKDEEKDEVGMNLLFAGREQYFRYAYKANKRYIETNNHITFFAHTLSKVFPSAKFIHLYRHPGEFVTSGVNRGWFAGNAAATKKIINPIHTGNWEKYTQIEKIAWVWNETNSFIESFKLKHPQRVFSYDFSKRDVNDLESLFDFLEISTSTNSLKKFLSVKKNEQKKKLFPDYSQWVEEDKEKLRAICQKLSSQYDYRL